MAADRGSAVGQEGGGRQGAASRRVAFEVLRRVHADGAWSPPALAAALRRSGLDTRDRAFAANLAYSTLRWEGTLDWALAQVLSRPLAEVEPGLVDVLRLGAWQVLYGRVPDRAAVATAVDLARAVAGVRATGFTNGVLRALARRRERLPWPPRQRDDGLALALGYPAWAVAEARARFGERAEAVLTAGNVPPGVTLRAVVAPAVLAAELRAGGLTAEQGRWVPEAVRSPHTDPSALAAVSGGRAVPQDEASMLVARAAAAGMARGAAALDACAAPGGKATHLAQLGLRVTAADLRPGRAELVASAAARLGVPVGVAAADALTAPWRAQAFDLVLLDAPCTGLGTARRRPEVRWRRHAEDPARLGALQLDLLAATAEEVRPGGRLVYSVCTWPAAETVEVIRAFLASRAATFRVEPPDLAGAGTQLDGDPGVQLTPDRDGTDAMYVCALRRTREGHIQP